MKIGCCVSLFHDAVFTLSGLGVDYAEIGLSELSLHSGEEISERAERLSEAGVPCLAGNVLFPGELALTGPHTELSAISEYLGATLEKAALLGVRTVVFGSGGSRRAPEGFPREAAWEQLRGLCAELLSPALQKHGMTCCIEPLNRRECNILNTSEECACLVRELTGTILTWSGTPSPYWRDLGIFYPMLTWPAPKTAARSPKRETERIMPLSFRP